MVRRRSTWMRLLAVAGVGVFLIVIRNWARIVFSTIPTTRTTMEGGGQLGWGPSSSLWSLSSSSSLEGLVSLEEEGQEEKETRNIPFSPWTDIMISEMDDFDPTMHNQTWDEMKQVKSTLPGLYWNDRLWLLGIHLTRHIGPRRTTIENTTTTTSRRENEADNDDDIFLTVFGMPGDFWNRVKSNKVQCPSNSWYHENGTILSYGQASATRETGTEYSFHQDYRLRFYATIPTTTTTTGRSTRKVFPLEFIKSVSGDANQNNNTLIWHGPLKGLKWPEIHDEKTAHLASTKVEKVLRITLHVTLDNNDDTTTETKNITTNKVSGDDPTPILTADIPISTGNVGHGGPQIMRSTMTRRVPHKDNAHENPQQQQDDPSSARADNDGASSSTALCVAIYGVKTLKYLPEFILHHSNLGFGPIIVGVIDATLGSTVLHRVVKNLQDFVEDGIVEVAAMGLPSPQMPALKCEVNVQKVHFYNTCVYHAKGRAPYVGIWDIDEFWMPPQHNIGPDILNSQTIPSLQAPSSTGGIDNNVWGQSNYSCAVTVGEAMQRVQAYHEQAGCGEEWCYHAFPSYRVRLQRHPSTAVDSTSTTSSSRTTWTNTIIPRNNRIYHDFGLRQTDIDWDRSKSITRTKYAHMGGIHQTGSCRYPSKPNKFQTRGNTLWTRRLYVNQTTGTASTNTSSALKQKCRNLRGPPRFGTIHHFWSLNGIRSTEMTFFERRCILGKKLEDDGDDDHYDDDDASLDPSKLDLPDSEEACVMDEYVQLFGTTIRAQLEQRRLRMQHRH